MTTAVSINSNPPAIIAAQNSLKTLRPSHEAIMTFLIIIIFQQQSMVWSNEETIRIP